MSLSSQVGVLATRVGTEIKTLRATLVPNSQRGPIGGVSTSSNVSGNVSLDPALSNHRRLTLIGDTTIAAMSAGVEGQRLLLEVNASGTQRTLTFATAYEVSQAVPARTLIIASGDWGYVALICRNGTWRLTSAEPQSIAAQTSTPSAWFPSDNGLLAWTAEPTAPTTVVGSGNGGLIGSIMKCDVSDTSTAISFSVATAGSGFTANRTYIGIWDASGALLTQTADLATTFNTTGVKTVSWTAAIPVTPQQYYVAFIATATSAPQLSATTGAIPSRGRTALSWRGSGYSTGLTALPNPRPTPTTILNAPWFGLA